MYVRVSSRKNKTGQVVRYLQLAHNEWDAQAGVSRTKVLHSFGREDDLDRPAIERLVAALTKLLDPAAAAALTAAVDMTFSDSRPIGGAYLLDGLWQRLGIGATIGRALAGRRVFSGGHGHLRALDLCVYAGQRLIGEHYRLQQVWCKSARWLVIVRVVGR